MLLRWLGVGVAPWGPSIRDMKALMGALALVVLCAVARAQEPSTEEYAAWRQLSDEYVECVTFYALVGICMESPNDKGLSERIMKTRDMMLESSSQSDGKSQVEVRNH